MDETPRASSAMGPAALDLLFLTFNCAKTLIEPSVFAGHLNQAFQQNAAELPDLVVFSLQEVSPLAYSFSGSYFLSPYYTRFEDALNLAALNLSITASPPGSPSTHPASSASSSSKSTDSRRQLQDGVSSKQPARPARKNNSPYTLVRSANVGMTSILLFARSPDAVRSVQVAECGFGIADMGNKGAVGLRISYSSSANREPTELTFVATHLAAMEWNVNRRNSNWRSIVSGLTFANPKSVVPQGLEGLGRGSKGRLADSAASEPLGGEDAGEGDGEGQWLLSEEQRTALATHHDKLRDISVFRPGGYLFLGGDLNYRIGDETPPVLAPLPTLGSDDETHWRKFLPRDQLMQEKLAGRTLHGLSEARIDFPPTYKFVALPKGTTEGAVNAEEVAAAANAAGGGDAGDGKEMVVPWKFATHRWPSWCDRVLYLDIPAWVAKRTFTSGEGEMNQEKKIDVLAYDSLPVMRSSDHQPVFLRARVPLLSPDELAPPPEVEAQERETVAGIEEGVVVDPRLKLPFPIDVDAWERRATARRKEFLLGCTALLWSTREGALAMASVVLVGVGSWWAYQGFF